MPLTYDFSSSPFPPNTKTGRGSQLLVHCILALSYKHINHSTGGYDREAKMHKGKALEIITGLDGNADSSPLEATFLDALLILMTLDVSTFTTVSIVISSY